MLADDYQVTGARQEKLGSVSVLTETQAWELQKMLSLGLYLYLTNVNLTVCLNQAFNIGQPNQYCHYP